MELDKKDRAILRILQRDGRITNAELSDQVNLSQSACLRRVKVLERAGVIEGYVAVIRQDVAGLPNDVFVQISVEKQTREKLAAFEQQVNQCPKIMECYLMSGDADYLLRVIVASAADYEHLHMDVLTALPGVSQIKSNFSLRTVTKRREIPLP